MSGQPGAGEGGPDRVRNVAGASHHGVDRRSLLRLGAAGAALAAVGCGRDGPRGDQAPPPPMRSRRLGATGLSVSEIAFGAHGVESAGLMRWALCFVEPSLGRGMAVATGRYVAGAYGELHPAARERLLRELEQHLEKLEESE